MFRTLFCSHTRSVYVMPVTLSLQRRMFLKMYFLYRYPTTSRFLLKCLLFPDELIRTTHQTFAYYCRFCGHSVFCDAKEWKDHSLRHHRSEVVELCEPCGKTFKTVSGYKNHQLRYHSDMNKFICQTCGKAFISEQRLATHQSVHSADKPFVCKICGNAYKYKCDLRQHETMKHPDLHV